MARLSVTGFGAPGEGAVCARSVPARSRSAIRATAPEGAVAVDPSVSTVTATDRTESPVALPVAASG